MRRSILTLRRLTPIITLDNAVINMWIHEKKNWTNFIWDIEALASKLADIRHRQGRLLGRMEGLGFELKREASLSTLTNDIVKSSAIEGENLNPEEVRSSIARRLGINIAGLIPSSRDETARKRTSSRLRRTNDRSVLYVHEDHEDDENAENGVVRRSLIGDGLEGSLVNDDQELVLMYDFWESLGVLDLKKRYRKQAESSWDYFKKYVLSEGNGVRYQPLKYLLTHAINLSENEIQELANYAEISLVSCPRSNQFLKHNMAKIPLWEQSGGINYGLGTDSKASNYDLDLRSELKLFVENAGNAGIGVRRQHHELTAQRQFELLTSSAAKAIGMDDKIGSLEDGKYADYVVFEVMDDNLDLDSVDPYALVLDGEKTRVKEVYVGGDLVHRS